MRLFPVGHIPLFYIASCKPCCFHQVFDKFVRVCDILSTFFVENLVANLLHAAGSQQVRARVRQMECRKKKPVSRANEPVEAGFSLRILLFVVIMT